MKNWKKGLSLLLAIFVLFGSLPMSTLASGNVVVEENSWNGKSAVFVGDSITEGIGTTKIYYQFLEEKLGLSSITSMGVAGSCISDASDYGENNKPLINRYQNIPSADLIVVFMGTNDYGHETPLGLVDDIKNGTFYGTLNEIVPALVEEHSSSKIVFVTPLHRYGFGTSNILGTQFTSDSLPNGVGATLGDYVEALKVVCTNNGVSVIDLYAECTLDPEDSEVRSNYMPDGLHPNAAGHELIAEIMEPHIRSYAPVEKVPAVEIEPEEKTELIYGNKFVSSFSQENRASSRVNQYLKAGTVITLKNPDIFQWACTKTSDENSCDNLGYFPNGSWSDQKTAVVANDGWIGFVFKYRDETRSFDLTKPLSDYITIEAPHSHTYEATVSVPTCTEQGYTTYTCDCGDSYVDDYADATGHTYENGICTGCGTSHPNLAKYEGKVISILGDSISTFAGYIPIADGFNLEHYARYPQANLFSDVEHTWWMQVLTALDAKLGINESWRSTEVGNIYDVEVNSGYEGTKACMASINRIQNLGSNGTPDVILFYGGTNDITQRRTVGTFNPVTAPTEVDLTSVKWDTVSDAYVAAIMRMQHYYPNAEIIAMLPAFTSKNTDAVIEEYNSVFAAICEHYGVTYIDLRDCGITTANLPDGTHPDETGMDYITAAVLDILLTDCNVEAGEHIVHSVTHNLAGAESSLSYYKGISRGKSYVTEITGEDLTVTVTMDGVDITSNCYANGIVSITNVTGDVVITAAGRGKTIYDDHLQQLPDNLCCGMNLWNMLTPENQYYTTSGWGNLSTGQIWSITIPVTAGDRIYANSFGKNGSNGNNYSSTSGIRVAYFDAKGVFKSLTPAAVYAEFAANGYLTIPEDVVAVCVPMWTNTDESAVYVLSADHTYENGTCTGCGVSAPMLKGKTISILGASISTYTGISNNIDYNSTIGSNAVYYTEGRHNVYANDTWWMQVVNDLDLELLVNNSWSGSSLLYERNGTVGAYVDRCVQLHNNAGEEPDIIAIQMGTNDFQYYKDTLGTADIDYSRLIMLNEDGRYTYAKPVTSLEAAAIVLHKISVRYPDAEVYYLNISQRVDGTDALIQSFNTELKKVVGHFDAHIVDIYGSAISVDSFNTYIGDGRVHPNKLGMDAYTEAFKRAVIDNTKYEIDTHIVSFDLEGVTANYGDNKIVVSGDQFMVDLNSADDMNVKVMMGGEDITSSVYANGSVNINEVAADVTISAEYTHVPQKYCWEFNGSDLACSTDNNVLTKQSGTITEGIFSNISYALEKPIVLQHDYPWVVEWKCEGTFQNSGSSTGARVFTSTDVNAEYNARYIFKSNKNGIIAMGEKTTSGSNNYGIALGDYGIDWTVSHTYRLENRITEDGTNMIYLLVDGEKIGAMDHYYVGTADKGFISDWLCGKDFVFPYMGTDKHSFTNASIEYIYVDEFVHSHTYKNGICTGCGETHPNLSQYKGKVISILGDSISTFAGYIPVADGFNLEHLARYPQENLLTDVNETWWMQVISQLDAKLGVNDSWRGATVSGAVPVTTGTTGENASMANLTRIQNLGSNGTPDVILFYGGTNDLAHVSKVGSFDVATAPTMVDLTTKKWDNLADGYVHTLLRLKHFYPSSQIVCLLPTYTTSYYSNDKLAQGNKVLAEICEHYGVPYVDLRGCGISTADLPDGIHPGATGMDYISNAVIECMLAKCEVEPGENTVYTVTHQLENAKVSLSYYKGISAGNSFAETITGNAVNVTVTMADEDITDSVYKDGKISIDVVTGNLVITALGKKESVHKAYLQQLPEEVCAGMNLWNKLYPDKDYYTANGWGVHSSGKVGSVTIPIKEGDQIYATSFKKAGENGSTINGIRLTWFGENDVLETVSPEEVSIEFAENGYLTAPKSAVAVNVPMWDIDGENELYILNRKHSFNNYISNNDATRYEDGTKTSKCVSCDATDTLPDEGSKKRLSNITISALPSKTDYEIRKEVLDLTGAFLTLNYENAEPEIIELIPEMVTGFDNRKEGSQELKVYFEGKTTTFTVNVIADENVVIETIPNQTYTGKQLKPEPEVYDGDVLLKKGKDYTLSYKNNVKAGIGQVYVKGKGNYTKTKIAEFVIEPKNLDSDEVLIACADKLYNGKKQISNPTVKWGNTVLKKDQDYTVVFQEDVISKGTVVVTISGKGNFSGTVETSYRISDKNIAKAILAKISAETYTGETFEPEITLYENKTAQKNKTPLEKGFDYDVIYENNVNAGKAKVTIIGLGEYCGSRTTTFEIKKQTVSKDISVEVLATPEELLFSGSAIQPKVFAKYDELELVEGTDYTLSYSDNKNVSVKKQAAVILKGKGNYAGTTKAYFEITPLPLDHAQDVGVAVSEVRYTGKICKPVVTVKIGSRILQADKDYKVSYKNNVTAAETNAENPPTAVVTGVNNYAGTIEKSFRIYEKSASSFKVDKISSMNFEPGVENKVKPVVRDSESNELLVENVDYVLDYQNHTKAGTAQLVIKGIESYGGSKSIKYTINKRNISNTAIKINEVNVIYTGKALTPSVTVTDGDYELQNGLDYSITYANNVNVATGGKAMPSVIVKGKGSYTGTLKKSFVIYPKELNEEDYTLSAKDVLFSEKKVNDNHGMTTTVTVKEGNKTLKNGTHYKVIGYLNNTSPGEKHDAEAPTAIVMGCGNYKGIVRVAFRIYKNDISKVSVEKIPNQKYTGNNLTPMPDVYVRIDKKTTKHLDNGTDYTVTWENNVTIGKGKIIITGIGEYGGTKTVTFNILPRWMVIF